jgi:hypothetical protein
VNIPVFPPSARLSRLRRRAFPGQRDGVDSPGGRLAVAAALDPIGGLLGPGEFPVTPAGYARPPG